MRRINKLKLNVGGSQIPETDEILDVGRISHEEACIVPSRAHRIVTAQPVPREVPQTWILKHINWNGSAFLDLAVDHHTGLGQNSRIVDAAVLRSWIRTIV